MKLPFGLRAANIQAKITFVMYWFMLGNETYYLHLHQGQWFVLPKGSPQKSQDIFVVIYIQYNIFVFINIYIYIYIYIYIQFKVLFIFN